MAVAVFLAEIHLSFILVHVCVARLSIRSHFSSAWRRLLEDSTCLVSFVQPSLASMPLCSNDSYNLVAVQSWEHSEVLDDPCDLRAGVGCLFHWH